METFGFDSLFAVLGASIVALSSLLGVVLKNTVSQRTFGLLAFVTFIGALVSAASAFWASHKTAIAEAEARSQRKHIEEQNSVISDQGRRIHELAGNIYKTVSGDGGYIWISGLLPYHPCHNGVLFTNESKYPLYDVQVRIVDLNAFDKNELESVETFIEIGNLPPMRSTDDPGEIIKLCDRENLKLNVFYSMRNGEVVQYYRAKLDKPTSWATKVFLNGIKVREYVSENFPKRPDGEPDWEFQERER